MYSVKVKKEKKLNNKVVFSVSGFQIAIAQADRAKLELIQKEVELQKQTKKLIVK